MENIEMYLVTTAHCVSSHFFVSAGNSIHVQVHGSNPGPTSLHICICRDSIHVQVHGSNPAAQKNYLEILGALLAHGANDTIQDDDGQDALKFAEEEDNQDAIRMFTAWKERSNVSQEMMTAAAEGKWRLVTGLVLAGADVETRNAQGETGLDLAIRSGNRDAVLTFLDKGVNGFNREESLQKCDENKERNDKLVEAANSGDNESVTRQEEKEEEEKDCGDQEETSFIQVSRDY